MNLHRISYAFLVFVLAVGPTTWAASDIGEGTRSHNPFSSVDDRIDTLEDQLSSLADIVDLLGHGSHLITTGPFALPAAGVSVDWYVINNSADTQTGTVTVYEHNLATGRSTVAPGAITFTLQPGESYHNANSIGTTFILGLYYEVQLERSSPNLMPSVNVWEAFGAITIPGTLIPAGDWVPVATD